MEDTLRAQQGTLYSYPLSSLNPCFNGRYSQRAMFNENAQSYERLNPCFNGRYSQSELGAYKTIAMSLS